MLKLNNIKKSFENSQVLDGISFIANAGEFIAIIGRSGCGKSTLLRVIGDLEKADQGSKIVDLSNPLYGFAFQEHSLLEWKSVAQNIYLAQKLTKTKKNLHPLDLVGLSDYQEHYPSQLSMGMKQRVSLARALSINPDVLLLDEPFSSLDALTKEQIMLDLQRLHLQEKRLTFFVTHDIEEAVFLSDRIIILGNTPTTITKTVEVSLCRPRPLSLCHTLEFQDIVKSVKEELYHEKPNHHTIAT